MTRQPVPGVYENYREPGEFGEGVTVRQTPAPVQHVEWGDWTVDDTDTAREILNYLGIGSDPSREPGADRRRDKIAEMIRTRIDAALPTAPSKEGSTDE